MEVINHTEKRTDTGLLVLTHLSQLLGYIIGFGSLIAPLIIWAVNKDRIETMDKHGKAILNFQISLLIWFLVCIPLCLILIGFFGFFVLALVGFIFPIINAVKASNGSEPYYPLSLQIIK